MDRQRQRRRRSQNVILYDVEIRRLHSKLVMFFFLSDSARLGSARSIANKYNTWILLLYNKHISFAIMFVYRRTSLVVNMYEIQGTQCKPSSILPPVDLTQRHNSQFDLSFFRSDWFHADCLLNQLEHDLLIIARLFNKSCYVSHQKKSQP